MTWRKEPSDRTVRHEAEGGCLCEVRLKSFKAQQAIDNPAYSVAIRQDIDKLKSVLLLQIGIWPNSHQLCYVRSPSPHFEVVTMRDV